LITQQKNEIEFLSHKTTNSNPCFPNIYIDILTQLGKEGNSSSYVFQWNNSK